MRKVNLLTINGDYDTMTAYEPSEFPFSLCDHKSKLYRSTKKAGGYCVAYMTFDIESTTIDNDEPYGFMYHWQATLDGIPVYGRTWESWIDFMLDVVEKFNVSTQNKMIVYVHNLSFEFQFIRDFLNRDFGGFDIFAIAKRKILKVTTKNGFEFRCSYKLTNMTLDKATKNELGVYHIKAAGDLDYSKIRTADTPLDDVEFGYCISDVVSLHELIKWKMINDHDDLESIPMTSTGYVRRDCRKACNAEKNYRQLFESQRFDAPVFDLLCECARGGDTHSNYIHTGRVRHDVDSIDAISDYPYQEVDKDEFPSSKWVAYGQIESEEELNDLIKSRCVIGRYIFSNLKIKPNISMPYIPYSKIVASNRCEVLLDNGRIRKMWREPGKLYDGEGDDALVQLSLTEIDYQIIKYQYDFDYVRVGSVYTCDRGYLPKPIRDTVLKYFALKCELKEKIYNEKIMYGGRKEVLKELEYLYAKSKNKLNAIFGMTYTNPCKSTIYIDENGEYKVQELDVEKSLDTYYKSYNSFLNYSWGVYTTALARRHLQDMRKIVGEENCIYCDTDSVKGINIDRQKVADFNQKVREHCDISGAYYDLNGKRYYLGEFEIENDEPIKKFKTLGAKKYCYEDKDGLHVTVSGVRKDIAAEELRTIDNFDVGFIFQKAGGLTLYYNDSAIHEITIDGCTMTTASNIGMVNSTYTLGITNDYDSLLGLDYIARLIKFADRNKIRKSKTLSGLMNNIHEAGYGIKEALNE